MVDNSRAWSPPEVSCEISCALKALAMESPLYSAQLAHLDNIHTYAWFMKRMGFRHIQLKPFLGDTAHPTDPTYLRTDNLIKACRRCIFNRLTYTEPLSS